MSRQKKNKSVQEKEKSEVNMTNEKDKELDTIQTEIDLARAELEKTKAEIEVKRQELEASAKREISGKEVILVEKQVAMTQENKAAKELIEKQKAFDNVPVTGKFINRRAPGQPAKLTYLKYQDDPVKWYTFEDGKVYTLPRGFADQINDHYYTPHFIQKSPDAFMDPNRPSSAIHDVDTSNKKYAFMPVNF